MSAEAGSVASGESLSPRRAYAAQLVASGMPKDAVMREVGIRSPQTMWNWMHDPLFVAAVEAHTQRVVKALSEQLDDGARAMLDLWERMVRGEVDHRDGRLDRIASIINRYYENSVTYDADEESPSPRKLPLAATQVNVYAGEQGSGAKRLPEVAIQPGQD